jgi:hypothetical protein
VCAMTSHDATTSSTDLAPIAVFLHVATLGQYQRVANEVLEALRTSDLFKRLAQIEVNVVGVDPFSLPYSDPRLSLHRRSEHVEAFEHPTLASMQRYANATPDASMLYLNCLGGRHVGANYTLRAEWRQLLYYLLIDRASDCLNALRTHDICGVDWTVLPFPHMTSNNWWARASHLAQLPSPDQGVARVLASDLSRFGPTWTDPAAKTRHAGEFWLGLREHTRAHSLLPLRTLGLPASSPFESVPWWGLPGVRWASVARRKLGDRPWNAEDIRFALLRLRSQVKHRIKSWMGGVLNTG